MAKVLSTAELKNVEISSVTVFEALEKDQKLVFGLEPSIEEDSFIPEGESEERVFHRVFDSEGRGVSAKTLLRYFPNMGNKNSWYKEVEGVKSLSDLQNALSGKTLIVENVKEREFRGNTTKQFRFNLVD